MRWRIAEEEINIPYKVGELVKVTDGPFNGFNGSIEEVNEEKKKLEGDGQDLRA